MLTCEGMDDIIHAHNTNARQDMTTFTCITCLLSTLTFGYANYAMVSTKVERVVSVCMYAFFMVAPFYL